MSADKILRSICCAEGGSSARNKTSALHLKNLPKYSKKCFQYPSESELAVGTKRIRGCSLFGKANNLAIDIGGAPGFDFSATDRDNCSCHPSILALKSNPSLPQELFASTSIAGEVATGK